MYTINQITHIAEHVHAEINGKWVPAKPEPDVFIIRLKDAIQVLKGNAVAVRYEQEQTDDHT